MKLKLCTLIALIFLSMNLYSQHKIAFDQLWKEINYYNDSLTLIRFGNPSKQIRKDTSVIIVTFAKPSTDSIWIGIDRIILDFQLGTSNKYFFENGNIISVFRCIETNIDSIMDKPNNLQIIDNDNRKYLISKLVNSTKRRVFSSDYLFVLTYNIKLNKIVNKEWYEDTFNTPHKYFILYPEW